MSFNKIFAKLGSDMKKPDAITCIEAAKLMHDFAKKGEHLDGILMICSPQVLEVSVLDIGHGIVHLVCSFLGWLRALHFGR